MSDKILPWRSTKTPAPLEYLLWSMQKKHSRIDCTLQDCRENGWRVRFVIDGDSSFSFLAESWALAIATADDKHAEFVRTGWRPVAATA